MNLPILLNLWLYLVVIYCIIVRVNLMQGLDQWIQRLSLVSILIGAGWQGFEPIVSDVPVYWGDLFLPAGLAAFFFRYVCKVERFAKAGFPQ